MGRPMRGVGGHFLQDGTHVNVSPIAKQKGPTSFCSCAERNNNKRDTMRSVFLFAVNHRGGMRTFKQKEAQ